MVVDGWFLELDIDSKLLITIEPRVYTIKEIQIMIERRAGVIREIAKYGLLLDGYQDT